MTHKDSNFRLVKEHLVDRLVSRGVFNESHAHPFVYVNTRKDGGVRDYAETLKSLGGRFDVVVLSSGEDGHIGGIYPNHRSFDSNTQYFLTMDDSPKPPKKRMTLSKQLLLQSQVAVLLFFGSGKRVAFERFVDPALSAHACPAKLVNQIPHAYALVDVQ